MLGQLSAGEDLRWGRGLLQQRADISTGAGSASQKRWYVLRADGAYSGYGCLRSCTPDALTFSKYSTLARLYGRKIMNGLFIPVPSLCRASPDASRGGHGHLLFRAPSTQGCTRRSAGSCTVGPGLFRLQSKASTGTAALWKRGYVLHGSKPWGQERWMPAMRNPRGCAAQGPPRWDRGAHLGRRLASSLHRSGADPETCDPHERVRWRSFGIDARRLW